MAIITISTIDQKIQRMLIDRIFLDLRKRNLHFFEPTKKWSKESSGPRYEVYETCVSVGLNTNSAPWWSRAVASNTHSDRLRPIRHSLWNVAPIFLYSTSFHHGERNGGFASLTKEDSDYWHTGRTDIPKMQLSLLQSISPPEKLKQYALLEFEVLSIDDQKEPLEPTPLIDDPIRRPAAGRKIELPFMLEVIEDYAFARSQNISEIEFINKIMDEIPSEFSVLDYMRKHDKKSIKSIIDNFIQNMKYDKMITNVYY